jgi:Tol biopolymer transport system component
MSAVTERMATAPRVPLRMVAVGLIALALIAGAIFIVGNQPQRLPAPFGPAGNGLIAYSLDGDIHVGDPRTGSTTPIVRGTESHINPVFSPDGSLIAFVRGDPHDDATLHVVRPDGSGERVIVPRGFSAHPPLGPYPWMPDGTALVVVVDSPPLVHPYSDGDMSVFDVSGRSEPRLLTPPLPSAPGSSQFNPSVQVAPMFRPPAGDLILSASGSAIEVYDADLQVVDRINLEDLAADEPYWGGLTWSPDGTMVSFTASASDNATRAPHLIVMNADGSGMRRLAAGLFAQWSPDSRTVAYERWGRLVDQPDPEIKIGLIDVESGAERVLESTRAPVKVGADVQTITWNTHHTWYYEGWQWSPDGKSLLILENHRTRPWLIDIAADTRTELPWVTDSNPSWQRVVSD